MAFLGTYEHSLDAKGRIVLPAKLRPQFAGGCVLARGQDRCLFLFTTEEWTQFTERLRETRVTSQQRRNYERLLFSGATEEIPDGQGRVTIAEPLRRYAGLERDVALIGAGSRMEIWDRQTWERMRGQLEEQYAQLAESHPDLPV
jgi:MraZ protein